MTTELRCRVTNNRCGTDTWAVGKPCQCNSCQHYVTALNAAPVERKAVEALKDALEAIEKWTPPMVVSRIDGRTVSMGSEFGSDGERDYFREVARKALDAAQGEAGPSREALRMFPIQNVGMIPWSVAEKAYRVYSKHYPGQSLERLAERGGFGLIELGAFLQGVAVPHAGLGHRYAEQATAEILSALARCTRESEQRPEAPVEAGPKRVHVAQEEELRAELPHAPVGTLFIRQSEDGPVDGAFWHNAQLAGLEDGEYEVFIGAKCAEPPVMKGHTGCLVCSGSGTVIVQGDGPLKVEPCPAGRADAQAAGSDQPLSDGGRGASSSRVEAGMPSISPLEPTPRACCDETKTVERLRCILVLTDFYSTGGRHLPDDEFEALATRIESGR